MASHAKPGIGICENASYAKRMSNHVAYALVAYTLLLIFEVSPQMEGKGMSIMPYFILVILVATVIIPCRNLERKWKAIGDSATGDLDGQFRREMIGLWLCAIGIPTALMAIIWIIP